ncbi:MAG TPA: trypsin-like peptidase domain-containing protein [Mycobacteriales bacterium]
MRDGWRRSERIAGIVAVGVLVAGVTACSNASAAGSTTASASPSPAASAPVVSPGAAAGLQQQYESVIKAVLPSIVEIRTDVGLGSGIVYDGQGDIVTNDHVVGNATTFQVQFASSAKPVPGTLVGTYPAGDLAVIKVSGVKNLRPAHFADSAHVQLGEIVLAMGNPLGFASSVTNGIVSAVGRTLTEPTSADSPGATLPDTIQTSAAINPGNSGGALVDMQGRVIGIPTLAATDQQEGGAAPGIGFAIPSNTVTLIAPQLIKDGKVVNSGRAALGIEVTTVVDQTGADLGAGVVSVDPGGAAAKAGIQAGDVITAVNGVSVTSAQELTAVLANLAVGQHVPVVVQRAGGSKTVHVVLGELPGSA